MSPIFITLEVATHTLRLDAIVMFILIGYDYVS